MKLLVVLTVFLSSLAASAAPQARGDLKLLTGVKVPERADHGDPVINSALAPPAEDPPSAQTDLVQYVLRAPDQDDAGSCLYMTLTGITEWWMAKLNPSESRDPDGPLDFSTRYFMNLGSTEDADSIPNWKTDSIFLLNHAGGILRNSDYRFTKGWYKEGKDGSLVKAKPNEKGASYDTSYNWIDERDQVANAPVKTPQFHREILFADPDSNQWDTAVAPKDIAEKIKAAILKNHAPVQVIYNHFGYWHSNFIVGFDDNADNDNCRFVRHDLHFLKVRPEQLRRKAANTDDPAERKALLAQAKGLAETYQDTAASFEQGGCSGKGVFYVRDSIYQDPNGPIYHYDPANPDADAPYSKPIVLLEYEWVRDLANHVIQFTIEN